jgi:hypothetical protein
MLRSITLTLAGAISETLQMHNQIWYRSAIVDISLAKEYTNVIIIQHWPPWSERKTFS